MGVRHVELPLPARRKTAGFHEEMVKFLSSISARIFGDRWSRLTPGLPDYKLWVVV
jgi:hypothetical protein